MMLLAADFHNARIDVFDAQFNLVTTLDPSAFVATGLPDGFAPFNVMVMRNNIYVAYAKQDDMKHDNVEGAGLGAVTVFDVSGRMIKQVVGGVLDAPWGMAIASEKFCTTFKDVLLVGNFGDGRITAFDLESAQMVGQLGDANGQALVIDGLWALSFGLAADQTTDSSSGSGSGSGTRTGDLFFASGPGMEKHGLFGKIQSN
jgi:uncharacterized protein (TIGR03118 family)